MASSEESLQSNSASVIRAASWTVNFFYSYSLRTVSKIVLGPKKCGSLDGDLVRVAIVNLLPLVPVPPDDL